MRQLTAIPVAVILAVGLAAPSLSGVHPALPIQSSSHTVTLRIGMPDAALTLDPALVADEQNVQLSSLLYSGLVRLDASYSVVKDAASSILISRDRRTYNFTLRSRLRFSNGDPVTAGDFKFAMQRSLNPAIKSPSAPTYLLDIQGAYQYLTGKAKYVKGISAPDAHTLRITTRWPIPYFLMELTYPTSFALDYAQLEKTGAYSTNWYGNPIASGHYRLKSWSGDRMELVPNKYYAGPRPGVGKMIISVATLPDTAVYQYISHSVDVLSLPQYDRTLLHQPGIREAPMLSVDGICMNFHRKPFQNRNIRLALTLALNRASLVSHTLGRSVTPFAGYVPMGEAGYDPRLHVLAHNRGAALKALQSAHYGKHLPSLVIYYAQDPGQAKLASAIASAWYKTLHIQVSTQALTLNTLVAKVQAGSLPLYLFGWSADYPDPHDWLSLQWETGALNNNVGYHNSRLDKLVQTADVTWSYADRMRLYDQAQQLLVNQAAWIPLYVPHRLVYLRSTVHNLSVTGYGIIPRRGNWNQVQVGKPASKSRR